MFSHQLLKKTPSANPKNASKDLHISDSTAKKTINSRHISHLMKVEYSQFRNIISLAGGKRIKSKGKKTAVYDSNNHLLAVLKAASIDAFGRCRPAEYYVRCSA